MFKNKISKNVFQRVSQIVSIKTKNKVWHIEKNELNFLPSNAHLRVFHNSITEESEGNGEDKVFTILILRCINEF